MANGASYEGDWVNDNCQGKGVYRFPNGAILDGDWSDCKFTVGRLTLADMAGTFEGTFTYIGADSNDYYHVYDTVLHNPDGSVFRKGKFSGGEFINIE